MRVPPLLTVFAAIGAILSSGTAQAKSDCQAHYLAGQEPTIPARLEPKTRELCYTDFALLHSGLSRTALWSAERLTSQEVKAARDLDRTGQFFPEPHVPAAERSELADYKRSGYDRGHLAPSGNMATRSSQQQSFSLANIIPQAPSLNRYGWASLEGKVRDAASSHGVAYVVTGPLFAGSKLRSLRGRVIIPTHVWKAVYVPKQGAAVYVAKNAPQAEIESMTVSQFTQRYAINPFPALKGRQSQFLVLD